MYGYVIKWFMMMVIVPRCPSFKANIRATSTALSWGPTDYWLLCIYHSPTAGMFWILYALMDLA